MNVAPYTITCILGLCIWKYNWHIYWSCWPKFSWRICEPALNYVSFICSYHCAYYRFTCLILTFLYTHIWLHFFFFLAKFSLQQWFEYCKNGKKTCPVCKQACKEKNVGRLYFQSVGETIEASFTQKLRDCEQNPEELRREVKRLQGRVFGLDSALEKHQKDLKDITEEVRYHFVFYFHASNWTVELLSSCVHERENSSM